MLQNISLNELLTFQSSNDPAVIADYMSSTNEWITNHSIFSDKDIDYDWFRATPGEEFVSGTKDRLSYEVYGNYEPVIVYITNERVFFDEIFTEISESGMTQIESRNVTGLNYYAYSSTNQVIQIFEPLVPHKGRLNHTFVVYTKTDYDKGFRIK